MANISANFLGIKSPNPFWLASAPPQPASKARSTFIFLSVGGALANQNGLGDFMPRKFDEMSAILNQLKSIKSKVKIKNELSRF